MKLSIITINYNNLVGLKKTYESVVCQTWTDYEWIIIDGGSTDGSREFIEEHQDKFAYWCSEPDKGVYNAMNKGIAKAQGDYLNFMNSGDCFYEKDTLEKVFSLEHQADILYGDWWQIWGDHENKKSFPHPVEIFSLYKENICHQAMFIKRDFHLKVMYDESYQILADYKNWANAILKGATFEYLPLIICKITMDGISSAETTRNKLEYRRLRKELFPPTILKSMQKMDALMNEPYQKRVRVLIERGGFPWLLTRTFLKIMKIFFLRDINEDND